MPKCTGKMFTYAYHIDPIETERTVIRMYGINEDEKSVCLRITDFTPFVLVELPKLSGGATWTKHLAEVVLKARLDRALNKHKALGMNLVWRKKLYSAQTKLNGAANKFPFLFCKFAVRKDIYLLKKILYEPLTISVDGQMKKIRMKIHEDKADEILQLMCIKNLPTSGWVSYAGDVPGTTKTSADIEVCASYGKIRTDSSVDSVNPLIMSFDIEAYSHQAGKFPNANHPEDKVFMISCVFFRNDGHGFCREVLLTMGNPIDKDVGAECLRYKTEGSLISGFSALIQKMNPQIITGWNIMGFDIEYLIKRSKITSDFDELGLAGMHLFRGAGKVKEIGVKTMPHKIQTCMYLEWEGRVVVDLLPVIKRDHKLNNYKLDTVAKHFLGGGGKEDLPVSQLFQCYDDGIKNKSTVNTAFARKKVGIAGKYCMVDSILVADIFRKTDTWIGLTEMASTCNVPMFDVVYRGQQKRVFAQVYKHCQKNGIVVESDGYKAADNERYVGAHVFAPNPGVYDNIVPFDFASLYPTTIIAYNIDYSTLVSNPRVPDYKCNVVEWEDHLGCEHDPKVKRYDQISRLIVSKEKEMTKLRTKRDRMRIVDFIPGYTSGKKVDKQIRKGAKVMRDRERRKLNRNIKKMNTDLKPYREERCAVKKGIPKMRMCAKHKYRFLKEPKGVIPTVLQNLLDSRKQTRALKKKKEKGIELLGKTDADKMQVFINVLEQRQKAKKVCANSMYGAMGVREGYLPFMPGAMCTTALGRRNNKLAAKTIVEKWHGKLVYGDTDSVYVSFPHIKGETHEETAALLWDYCLKVAEGVTKMYPQPMKLEFEQEIYFRFLILSKKRYMYKMMKRDGIVLDEVGNKGVLLSRRDNSDVVRDIYAGIVMKIFDQHPVDSILDWIFEQVLKMFQGTLSIEKFSITKAVGSVGNLPLVTDGKGVENLWVKHIESGAGNKSPEMIEKLAAGKVMVGDYTISKLSRDPIERTRQLKLKMATDAVGYYTNALPAHVALAMKMRSRGVRVDDGVRLEHVVTRGGGHTDKMFSKVEDVQYYRRNARYLHIDFLYYLKSMSKPIDQVLNACYKQKSARNFMTRLYKHWIARTKIVDTVDVKPSLVFVDHKVEKKKVLSSPPPRVAEKKKFSRIVFL